MADPICRWRNATPKTICEIVETIAKNAGHHLRPKNIFAVVTSKISDSSP